MNPELESSIGIGTILEIFGLTVLALWVLGMHLTILDKKKLMGVSYLEALKAVWREAKGE